MKIKYIKIILITIAIYLTFSLNNVFAASAQPALTIEPSKETIKPGEEFTVTVKFDNNKSTECYGFDFNLEYDVNTFELIETKKIISEGTGIINNKKEGIVKFVLASVSAIEQPETLFEATLKVKQNANGGKTTLNISTTSNRAPIENDKGEVQTTTTPTNITIDAEITEEKSSSKVINMNEETNQNNTTSNEEQTQENTTQNKIVIKLDEEENNTSEDTTKNANEETAKSKNNEQSGLPAVAVAILIIISVIGLSAILIMLKKNKNK